MRLNVKETKDMFLKIKKCMMLKWMQSERNAYKERKQIHTSVKVASKDVFAYMDAYPWKTTNGIELCVCIECIYKYLCKDHI